MTHAEVVSAALQSGVVLLVWMAVAVVIWLLLGWTAARLPEQSSTRQALLRLRMPAVASCLIAGLLFASGYWPLSEVVRTRVRLAALVCATFVGAIAAARITSKALEWYLQVLRTEQQATALLLIRRLALTAIWVVAGLIALDLLGYRVGPLIASLGIAGIAVAVSMQDMLSGLFAGLYLALARPFVLNEYIRVDGGAEGFVEQIGLRNTILRSRFGEQRIILPNVNLIRSVVTALPSTVHEVTIRARAAATTDVATLQQACLAAAQSTAGADPTSRPVFRVVDLPAGTLEFTLTARFSEPEDVSLLEHRLRCSLHTTLRGHSITLA